MTNINSRIERNSVDLKTGCKALYDNPFRYLLEMLRYGVNDGCFATLSMSMQKTELSHNYEVSQAFDRIFRFNKIIILRNTPLAVVNVRGPANIAHQMVGQIQW